MDKGIVPEPIKELRRKLCGVYNLDVRKAGEIVRCFQQYILESGNPILALGSLFCGLRGNRSFFYHLSVRGKMRTYRNNNDGDL